MRDKLKWGIRTGIPVLCPYGPTHAIRGRTLGGRTTPVAPLSFLLYVGWLPRELSAAGVVQTRLPWRWLFPVALPLSTMSMFRPQTSQHGSGSKFTTHETRCHFQVLLEEAVGAWLMVAPHCHFFATIQPKIMMPELLAESQGGVWLENELAPALAFKHKSIIM